jgi:hypothetical protein
MPLNAFPRLDHIFLASSRHPSLPQLLRAVDIRDGDDDHLELCLDSCHAGRVVPTAFVQNYRLTMACIWTG